MKKFILIAALLSVSACKPAQNVDHSKEKKTTTSNRAVAADEVKPGNVSSEIFENPYFQQIVDSDRNIVCFSYNGYGKGDISCVPFQTENIAGKVFAVRHEKPFFFQIVDEVHQVVCYGVDSSVRSESRHALDCQAY